MNVPLLNFFHNVSQFLPNPEFVSILGKKVIFSKGHPYSISIFVSWCSPIMLASFKTKIWNVFCPAIFLYFRMVWQGRNRTYVELYLLKIKTGKLDQKVFQLIVRTEGCFWKEVQFSHDIPMYFGKRMCGFFMSSWQKQLLRGCRFSIWSVFLLLCFLCLTLVLRKADKT